MSKTTETSKGLTPEKMLKHFRKCTGWKCEPNARITYELIEFANERLGSKRDIDELHVIFCMVHGIKPYA